MHAPFTFRRRWIAVAAVTAVAALPATAGAAPAPQAEIDAAVSAGATWIADQQDKNANGTPNPSPNGSLPGFQGNWALTTLAAGGINAADVQRPDVPVSLQDYTYSTYMPGGGQATLQPFGGTQVAGAFGREALIASSAGIRVTQLTESFNLTASLASKWRPAQGDFGGFAPNSDGFALLATQALHLPKGVRQKIVANLLTAQKTGTTADAQGRTAFGGWSFTAGVNGTGDIDMTGAVLSMLCQEGMTPADAAVANGIDFLHRRLNQTTGGFGVAAENYIAPNNTPSAAWAVIGLKACGVDVQGPAWTTSNDQNPIKFLLSQQRTDPAVPGAVGSVKYLSTSAYPAPSQDMNATEAGIRALSNSRWYSNPPQRRNPSDPRWRATPTVEVGTTVPVALSVDPGNGDVRFCAVQIPSGAPLTDVLETARTTAVPSSCISEWAASGEAITTINGQTGTQWRVRLADGESAVARNQSVGFGDVVALELVRELTTTESSVDFGVQPLATIGAAQTVSFTATANGTQVRRLAIDGTDVDDFLVGRNTCVDATLDAGQTCVVSVRFAPGATGARSVELSILGAAGTAISPAIALNGQGGELPKGEQGVPGATVIGPLGPQGAPGPSGATGKAGKQGKTGKQGKAAAVSCRVTGARVQRVHCTVSAKAGKRAVRVRLTRLGKTYATGTLRPSSKQLTVRAARKVTRARYTLRLGSGTKTTNFAVRIG